MSNVCRKLVVLLMAIYLFPAHAGTVADSVADSIGDPIADPTKPTGYRQTGIGPSKKYRLESILLGLNRKVAIINGRNFSEGDSHALGKIMSINSNSVVVQGKKRHTLKLVTQSIKNPVDKK